ncbi:hypothetical protein RFI_26755, partial [Reticulomyxa filosa]
NKENVSKKTDDSVCNVNYILEKVKDFFLILFNFDAMTAKYVKYLVKSTLFFIDKKQFAKRIQKYLIKWCISIELYFLFKTKFCPSFTWQELLYKEYEFGKLKEQKH